MTDGGGGEEVDDRQTGLTSSRTSSLYLDWGRCHSCEGAKPALLYGSAIAWFLKGKSREDGRKKTILRSSPTLFPLSTVPLPQHARCHFSALYPPPVWVKHRAVSDRGGASSSGPNLWSQSNKLREELGITTWTWLVDIKVDRAPGGAVICPMWLDKDPLCH